MVENHPSLRVNWKAESGKFDCSFNTTIALPSGDGNSYTLVQARFSKAIRTTKARPSAERTFTLATIGCAYFGL